MSDNDFEKLLQELRKLLVEQKRETNEIKLLIKLLMPKNPDIEFVANFSGKRKETVRKHLAKHHLEGIDYWQINPKIKNSKIVMSDKVAWDFITLKGKKYE